MFCYIIIISAMNITCKPLNHKRLLPYDGANIEFLSKNMRIPTSSVFDVLSVVAVSSEELVSFLVQERIKNRLRSSIGYTHQLYRTYQNN